MVNKIYIENTPILCTLAYIMIFISVSYTMYMSFSLSSIGLLYFMIYLLMRMYNLFIWYWDIPS